MYNFSEFSSLLIILVVIAVVYIFFRWLQVKRKEDARKDEDQQDDRPLTM